MKPKSAKIGLLLLSLAIVTGLFFLPGLDTNNLNHATPTALKDQSSTGTPPRIEREYKHRIEGANLKYFGNQELLERIRTQIANSLQGNTWQAPAYTNTGYYIDDSTEEYVYMDIYFDTSDDLLLEHDISYRLRQRFKDLKVYEAYLEDPTDPDAQPYRIEFQNKLNRQELEDGFSTVEESRFEFREESEPFSIDNPPPSQPWNLREFIGYFQQGKYKDYYLEPTNHLLNYLVPEYTQAKELLIEPKTILVTIRNRAHLNIPSQWGSGPNPEQAYILSLDEFRVYDAPTYLAYLFRGNTQNYAIAPAQLLGFNHELEVEFERNVSTKLDEQLAIATGPEKLQLSRIHDAFLADQKNIVTQAKAAFNQIDLELISVSASKYQEAREIQANPTNPLVQK